MNDYLKFTKHTLIAAPLAGFSDAAFRQLAYENGADFAVTEMISCKGILYKNKQTLKMLRLAENEKPSCVQLFGSNPDDFYNTIKSGAVDAFDAININMGCPVGKIVKSGEGSALINTPSVASKIVHMCKCATNKHISVKTRLGVCDKDSTLSFCKMLQDSGADSIALHGRTANQMYGGSVDYGAIEKIAEVLQIPVLLNGDVANKEKYDEIIKNTACRGVMIGRGAIGNLGIFNTLKGFCAPQKKELMLRQLQLMQSFFDMRYTITNFRKHFAFYVKGLRNAAELKRQINKAETIDSVLDIIQHIP